jgi:hypothetical protein
MDNHEMVKLQRKVIKGKPLHAILFSRWKYLYMWYVSGKVSPFVHGAEQDAELEILEETVTSTKHIALAINGELDLQTTLIVSVTWICPPTNYGSWNRAAASFCCQSYYLVLNHIHLNVAGEIGRGCWRNKQPAAGTCPIDLPHNFSPFPGQKKKN